MASTDVILSGGGSDADQAKLLALGQGQNIFEPTLENDVVAVSMTAMFVGLSFFLGVIPPENVEIGARLGRILGQGNLDLVDLADGFGIQLSSALNLPSRIKLPCGVALAGAQVVLVSPLLAIGIDGHVPIKPDTGGLNVLVEIIALGIVAHGRVADTLVRKVGRGPKGGALLVTALVVAKEKIVGNIQETVTLTVASAAEGQNQP